MDVNSSRNTYEAQSTCATVAPGHTIQCQTRQVRQEEGLHQWHVEDEPPYAMRRIKEVQHVLSQPPLLCQLNRPHGS
jgi:hypothetical protein